MAAVNNNNGGNGGKSNRATQIILIAVVVIGALIAQVQRGVKSGSKASTPAGKVDGGDLTFDPGKFNPAPSGKSGGSAVDNAVSVGGLLNGVDLPDLPNAKVIQATCTSVVDGDTIHAVDRNKKKWNVRILGIDTMETHNEDKAAQQGRRHGHSKSRILGFGNEAKAIAEKMLKRKPVNLVCPLGKVMTDPYGRLLAYVEAGGQDYGSVILQRGLAEARRESHARKGIYHRMVDSARRAKLGIHQ